MAVVKVYHDPGHALVRVHDDYILPPEERKQVLKELAQLTYDILWAAEEKRIKAEKEAEKQKETDCTGAIGKENI